jgi:DUF4097 and DUF4098 domain-containing protein YvlB
MTHHRNLGLAVAAALLLAGPAQAQRQVNARHDASSTGTVEITLGAGSVRVTGWSRGEVQVTGSVQGRDEVHLDGAGRTVEVRVGGSRPGRGGNANIEVRVPAGSSVEITAGAAPITVSGVTGLVEASSRSGGITVRGNTRGIEAVAHSGPVTVEGRTGRLEVTSMSGPVRVTADVPGRTEIQAMSGPVDLLGAVNEVEVNALSGNVRVANATGRVEVEGVSGNISVTGTRLRGNVNTVSGSILVNGSLAGPMNMESHGGDVELRLPSGASAEVEVATFSGGFRSEIRGARESRDGRHERRISIGRGGPAVSISTFSGDVKLSRR